MTTVAVLLDEAIAVLGPSVPSSVTDQGAFYEWHRALVLLNEAKKEYVKERRRLNHMRDQLDVLQRAVDLL